MQVFCRLVPCPTAHRSPKKKDVTFRKILFYLFCFYFLFLYNLILLFVIGNTCTEMVILNKLVVVIAIIICWIHSSAFPWFMWNSSVCESFHFFISVHLISALFEVSDFLSAEVFPGPRKRLPFLWVEVTCPFNRGNRYKDYVHIFWDQILCPLNGGVPKRGWSITLFAQLNQHGWGC